MAIKKPDDSEQLPFNDEKIISLEENKEKQAESIKVNFQDEDLASEFASQTTKISKEEESINPNTSADDIKNQVLDYEKSKSSKMEYKDLIKTAEFLINLIDTAISTGLNFLAKDSSIQSYSMPVPNKKLMTEQLALILSKYQSKFSVEFLFFSGLIVLYAPMAVGAVKNRKKEKINSKKINEEVKKEIAIKVDKALYKNDSAVSSPAVEIKKEENIIEEKEMLIKPIRRKKGAQPKAN